MILQIVSYEALTFGHPNLTNRKVFFMSKKLEEAETKIVETVKEAKKKNPSLVKWIAGVIIAAICAAIGFFGGLFGLSTEQQDNLKKMITNSTMYQEAVADQPVNSTSVTEVKK